MIGQGDKLILGAYISLAELGIYNIGYFLGSLPVLISGAFADKILLPLYRMRPPSAGRDNQIKVFRTRRVMTAALILLSLVLAFTGVPLVDLLYYPRYALAGPVVSLLAVALVPAIVLNAYAKAFLAAGDSRQHLILVGATAVLQTGLLFAGVTWLGVFGAILAPPVAALAVYPLRVAALRRYHAWDGWHDAAFFLLGFGGGGVACWWHWDRIAQLIG
jgi:O-antigen/teichoic acid export membrane protein